MIPGSADTRTPATIARPLTLELVRVTERAAIAAAGWRVEQPTPELVDVVLDADAHK